MIRNGAQAARQKVAEREVEGFRKNLGPFVVAAETSRSPMVFTNAAELGNPIVFVNDAFLALTGYAREELLGQGFSFLLARGANPDARARIETAFTGDDQGQLEICDRRKDGSTFWTSVCVNPVYDEAGAVVQHFSSFVDISEPKREAENLRFLLDELNHRTQNTLATVLAIAAQTLSSQLDYAVVETFEGRVLALSKAHSLLGSENWNAVRLHDLLDRVLQPFGLNDDASPRFTLEGDEVHLHPKAALSLTLAFHELAANALKHGSLSVAEGHVAIGWRVEQTSIGARMLLRWRERDGPPVAPPGRKGFGARLIEQGLAQDLGGDVHLAYERTGLVCQITVPLQTPLAR